MAAPAPEQPRGPVEVIDLVSSDDHIEMPARPRVPRSISSDTDSAHETPLHGAFTPDSDGLGDTPGRSFGDSATAEGGTYINIDGEDVFIPDEELEEAPDQASAGAEDGQSNDRELALDFQNQEEVTVDYCLQRVLEIFPDICHQHVNDLWNQFDHDGDYEMLPGQARLDNIIEQLISGISYPKQPKGKQPLKRKRENSINDDDYWWERPERPPMPMYKGAMQAMLKAEFPDIPKQYINDILATHRFLFPTFVALAKALDDNDENNRPFGKGRNTTSYLDATMLAESTGNPELLQELGAARKHVQAMRAELSRERARKQAEAENLKDEIAAGRTAECSACYDDLPMNRQIHCNGAEVHFTCFDCAKTYITSEVGESRCHVVCPSGCGAGFAHSQLNLLEDKQLLGKLAQLQQEKDIRDAELDNLEECPFCDYKAILPPIEEDFELRCANPECEKVSCRRCKATSHVPISCEQHAKDNKANSRHKIEEAMTAALIRTCNRCKKQFIKEYGCNKMTCPSCGNLQCYVCSITLKDYNHFDQQPGRPTGASASKQCPLYDNVEERHEREIREAEATARAEVVAENPDVTAEDLEIKVSDAVKKATNDRIRRAGGPEGPFVAFGPPPPFEAFVAADHFRFMNGLGADDDQDALDLELMGRGARQRRAVAAAPQAAIDAARRRAAYVQQLHHRQGALQHRRNYLLHQQAAPGGPQNPQPAVGYLGVDPPAQYALPMIEPFQRQAAANQPGPQPQANPGAYHEFMHAGPQNPFDINDPLRGVDFGADGAADFDPGLRQRQPAQAYAYYPYQPLQHRHIHQHYHNPPIPAQAQPVVPAPNAPPPPPPLPPAQLQQLQQQQLQQQQQELQQLQQLQQQVQQQQQAAEPDIRAQRNRFQHLEMLRRQHHEQARVRQRQRDAQMQQTQQRQQQAREQLAEFERIRMRAQAQRMHERRMQERQPQPQPEYPWPPQQSP